MEFDAYQFSKILSSISSRISAFFYPQLNPSLRIIKCSGEETYTFLDNQSLKRPASNHSKLHREVFLQTVTEDVRIFEDQLRSSFPVFDNDCLSFDLFCSSGPHHSGQSQYRLAIPSSNSRQSHISISDLVGKMVKLHDRIGSLPRATRTYLVENIRTPASSPREALRIYLALHRPDLFEVRHKSLPPITVSEIIPVSIEDALS